MQLTKATNGEYLLHVWREGEEYFRQKSPVFLKEFNNVMFSVFPTAPRSKILHLDISRKVLPFPDNAFDAVNAYHVFEHLYLSEGKAFAREIFRVLKPGGIFRISVPDLERIAREYLEYLEKSIEDPNEQNLKRYRWTVFEMIDQATREYSGGLMFDAIRNGDLDRDFIKERYSDVFDPFFERHADQEAKTRLPVAPKSLKKRLMTLTPDKIFRKFKMKIDDVIFKTKKDEVQKATNGDPRKTKEAVRWMHDRLSLRLLTEQEGFTQFSVKDFDQSGITDWKKYDLDQSNYGKRAIDPSVYVECRKPA